VIVFHNDHLAPPELCRLLSQLVPVEHHTPVVFRLQSPLNDRGRRSIAGMCCWSRIEVYLHTIYADRGLEASSQAAKLWKCLLHVSLHEFGHVATDHLLDTAVTAGYDDDDDAHAHAYVERAANQWSDRVLEELLDHDPRLGQPRLLTGYLGGRHAKDLRWLRRSVREQGCQGSIRARLVDEYRCMTTGAQLTAGHVLWAVRSATGFTLSHRQLRRIADDLGIEHVDAASRSHRLYTWGDLREIKIDPSVVDPDDIETLEDLSRLGEGMRAAFLRAALREHTDG